MRVLVVVVVVCIGQLVYCRPLCSLVVPTTSQVWHRGVVYVKALESVTSLAELCSLCCWVTTVINQSKLPIFKPSLRDHPLTGMVPAQWWLKKEKRKRNKQNKEGNSWAAGGWSDQIVVHLKFPFEPWKRLIPRFCPKSPIFNRIGVSSSDIVCSLMFQNVANVTSPV